MKEIRANSKLYYVETPNPYNSTWTADRHKLKDKEIYALGMREGELLIHLGSFQEDPIVGYDGSGVIKHGDTTLYVDKKDAISELRRRILSDISVRENQIKDIRLKNHDVLNYQSLG